MAGLYPNTPFTDGSIFTPDLADLAMEAPIFDDQPQYKGHRVRILDSELSNNPGQIKDRVAKLTDNLKLSVVSGLTLSYTSGSVQLPDGAIQAIPANQIVVPDNTTSYIWVNSAGQVVTGAVPPVSRVLLGKATAVSGTITILEDLRSGAGIPEVKPMARSIRSFGGWGDEGDYVATNGAVLDQGEYYFSSFTVPAGVSITVDKFARINVSGDTTIDGTINVTPCLSGGGGTLFYLSANAQAGGESGAGVGGGSGELPKGTYNYLISPVGSGGGAGYIQNLGIPSIAVINKKGGSGGGGLIIQSSGIISVSGTINASGGNGDDGVINTNHLIGGCGGGSGGLILLQSLSSITISATASLIAKGGNGGVGYFSTSDNDMLIEPGSGGGGGRVVLYAPAINITGSNIDVSGGSYSIINTTFSAAFMAIGGTGGSFGGLGGHQLPYSSGQPGVITIRLFTPIG